MATKTYVRYPVGLDQYRIPFDYLARPFVSVMLINSSDETDTKVLTAVIDYTFATPTIINISADTTGYDIVQIYRYTDSKLVVSFKDGSVLTASDLTNAELQAIHIAEEARDVMVREVQPAIDEITESFAKNLRVEDLDLNPLPPAAERRNKLIGFGDDGQALMVLPAEGSAADVMIELAKPTGAGKIGTDNGSTVQGNLTELNSIILPTPPTGRNIAQLMQDRIDALSSNTIRFTTWNIQGYYIVGNEQSPQPPDVVDTTRFGRDVTSPIRIREQMEWILHIGADFVGMQEVCLQAYTKQPWQKLNTLGYAWQMFPYHQSSYYGIESYSYPENIIGNPVGNLSLATRPLTNGRDWKMYAPESPYGPYNSVHRVEMKVGDTTIAIYNTHLNVAEVEIHSQVAFIANLLESDTATHIVLMGDWNWNEDSTYQPFIDLGFTMVNKNGELGTYNGLNENWGQWYLDRIFHRGFSAQGDYGVLSPPRELGDHKPLWCDLTI